MISTSCQHSGFLFKRKLSFDCARDLPTDNQYSIKTTLLLKKFASLLIEEAISAQSLRLGQPPKWHGATATTAMTHIAIQDWLDGKPVDWMEQVSDEQYHN
jgi:hypothetical protein